MNASRTEPLQRPPERTVTWADMTDPVDVAQPSAGDAGSATGSGAAQGASSSSPPLSKDGGGDVGRAPESGPGVHPLLVNARPLRQVDGMWAIFEEFDGPKSTILG